LRVKAIRKSCDRGHFNFGWLDTYHTFSFGSYFDPKWMGFSKLRVINEDFINEGKGFDTHPHKDMEILTFILEGAIQHRDTMGNSSTIVPGEIQIMSAGTGVMHSEFNPSSDKKTHLLQIWIEPDRLGVQPRYEQLKFIKNQNQLNRIADSKGGEGIAMIHQDVILEYGHFEAKRLETFHLDKNRHYWLHLIDGELEVDNEKLSKGDAIAVKDEESVALKFKRESEFLLFNLV
jgi:redox-sensitive bicupin YhaK (pirin superfamily)